MLSVNRIVTKNWAIPYNYMGSLDIIPQHISIIMDGNGRWSKLRNVPKLFGYRQGVIVAEKMATSCQKYGVKYLTLYAFSTENWHRPAEEVDVLMNLFKEYLLNNADKIIKNDTRIIFIGDRGKLDHHLVTLMNQVEGSSATNSSFTFIIAVNYGGRNEIRQAAEDMANFVRDHQQTELSSTLFDNFINPHRIPCPDLLIRTGGECRLSNFLLWHIAYTELYFTKTLWPDFDEDALLKAVAQYQKRDRRMGK
ncbi:ditrans,polycis-undecaprenyl-diphosphate synthase ((2E,6E)-farnesyl-diphosphate specific) [Alphaproteobacteria bacterium]